MEPDGEELSVQAAYTPESTCFGCGSRTVALLMLCHFLHALRIQPLCRLPCA
jgi:hypothetical protein